MESEGEEKGEREVRKESGKEGEEGVDKDGGRGGEERERRMEAMNEKRWKR